MKNKNTGNTIIKSASEMRAYAAAAKARGGSVGLVPTMGALHDGHLSLVRAAAAENDVVVVSIFVNPIQFDDPDDLALYPETLTSDAAMAFGAGADAVFAPGAGEMYPEGFSTYVDMTGVSEQLCGAARPSHFRGVLTVVCKLFGVCSPDKAYFGEKDAQQLAVVRKMTSELCMNVTIIGCPTVREEDGLAMSSRNARLSGDERIAARCLYRALEEASRLFDTGETAAAALSARLLGVLESEPLVRVDYAEIVDPETFMPTAAVRKGDLMALAVYVGDTRLIDNRRL